MNKPFIERLVASPCSTPEMGLEEALKAHSGIGFRKFEVFTSWAQSAFQPERGAEFYLKKGRKYGLTFSSLHLPPITDDLDESLEKAVLASRFAREIGARIVLYKATSRENYIRGSGPFLSAIEGLEITPVLQNHAGSPITTLEDFREVIEGINDSRMKTLLEVGHFHTAGVSWRDGYDFLGQSIALVHIKDQIGSESVPFGKGEIDLPGLFRHLRSVGYQGNFVVEMEVRDRENTLRYLEEALEYLDQYCREDL